MSAPEDAPVNQVARIMLAAWEKAEGKPVNVSYVATFADMARAVLAEWVAGEKARAWDEALRPLARVALRRYPNGLMSTATVIADIEESRRRNPYLTFGREETP